MFKLNLNKVKTKDKTVKWKKNLSIRGKFETKYRRITLYTNYT